MYVNMTFSPKFELKNGKVVKRDDATNLNTKLLPRMQEVQRIIDEAPYVERLSCAELVASIMHMMPNLISIAHANPSPSTLSHWEGMRVS